MIDLQLLQKYNVPIPRYTSYPTVPNWQEKISVDDWKRAFKVQFNKGNRQGISLYLHLPFCESLCTYCGCNKKITTNHSVENEYIPALLKEWQMYLDMAGERPLIREIHLGGGTPTFFSPDNLIKLISGILEKADIHPDHDFSIEGHPNNTTREHLEALRSLGFRRISYGVQDNDPEVQRIINRIQPFENVQNATEMARELGFESVNFDLIYGLPHQTLESIKRTIEQTISLKPDRVAFYSYAHVPWTSRGQRLFDEHDLPDAALKMQLYLAGKELFLKNGYYDIGMDHFALPTDDLYKAAMDGTLHRNFMGYTTQHSAMLIGLGVSSISDLGNAYGQNVKTLHDYYQLINEGTLAIQKGYFLSDEDTVFKQYILDMSCRGVTTLKEEYRDVIEAYTMPQLHKLEQDGLVIVEKDKINITPLGRHFIRNICSAFDLYIQRNAPRETKPIFSKAI